MFLDIIHRPVYISMFLDIIHRPVFSSKHNVSEIEFCLCLQVEPTQVFPMDRATPYLRTGQVLPQDGERIQPPKRCF
jgi:hypothetical protein